MDSKLDLTAVDLDLRFPIFHKPTPGPPRLTMDHYYQFVRMMHAIRFPKSTAVKHLPAPGPCPVRFTLDS
ncbi:MAG: hypothetical protein HY360_10515 [Verrucomicrobia bacterium]|nr:hypothetical protein [Verrucomicrobiota bacterium]